MDGPSPALRTALDGLARGGVAGRGVRRRVRRLAGSLPVDDGLWLAALHAEGRLTEPQCDALRTGDPAAVRAGGWVLHEPLGGRGTRTWTARPHNGSSLSGSGAGGATVALKRVAELSDPEAVAEHLRRLAGVGAGSRRAAAVVVPHRVERHGSELVLISRLVPGESWTERLARLGRFGADELVPAAARLAAGLADLEAGGLVHGDLRAKNVRAGRRGRAVLVDAGLAALPPADPHAADPETAHGVAPEAAVPGAGVTTGADIYAFGCLLWRAAVGQPVFPRATAAAVRVAHRTRGVPPLCDFRPDLPDHFTDAVDRCTRFQPGERPTSFAEVAGLFAGAARGLPAGGRRVRRRTALAAAALLAASAGAAHLRPSTPPPPESMTGQDVPADRIEPLPEPDRSGRVTLRGGVRYAAAGLPPAPVLHVACGDAEPAEIVVADRPLRLTATAVHLRNVRVVAAGGGAPSLLAVEAADCALHGVLLDGRSKAIVGLAVRPGAGLSAGRLTVRDSLVTGCVTGVLAERTACTLEQSAVTAADRALSVKSDGSAAVALRRCTLRATGPAVTLGGAADPCTLTLDRCVLSLTPGDAAGAGRPAIGLDAPPTPRQVLLDGRDTVLHGYERPVGTADGEEPPDVWDVSVTGVRNAAVTFGGGGEHAGVRVVRIAGPRRAGVEVGCDPGRLPGLP